MRRNNLYDYDLYLLKHIGNNGFFVDVGAYFGNISNRSDLSSHTLRLEQSGWNGICIESSHDNILTLQNNRKCIIYEGIVGDGKMHKFYQDKNGGAGSKIVFDIPAPTNCIDVQTELLENILNKNNAPQNIDFLKIDVEGAELTILQTLSYETYTYKYILFENPNCRKSEANDLINFLLSKGYIEIGGVGTLNRNDSYNTFLKKDNYEN